MLKEKGDGPHLYKIFTQTGEHHQLAMSDNNRVIPGHYNPLEEVLTQIS